MNALTDELLMSQIQSGYLVACGTLYERYKKVLFAYFFNNCHNQEVSEDLVQTTFEKVIKYRKNYTGKGSFKSWMFAIARNAYIDEYKKKINRDSLKSDMTESVDLDKSYDPGSVHEDKELLWKSLQMLSAEKRELLVLTKIKGLKYKEVGEILQLSESNLKTRIYRIMKELKGHINYLMLE